MISRGNIFYSMAGVLCLLGPVSAQAETLREAVTTALASHPGVDIAKAQKEGASQDESEAFSNLFPELNVNATGGRAFENNATSRGLSVSRGEAYTWLWEGSTSLTQPIFDGFKTYNQIDAAQLREGAADFTLADAQQGVALHAAQAFLNVMRAQEAFAKATSYKDKIADYVSRIGKMVDGGAADESESAQAKNIQAQFDNTVAEMEGAVKSALADYTEATGSMPAGELQKAEDLSAMEFKNADEAINFADEHHPLILSAQKNIEAEDNDVDAERGSLFPSLDGQLSYLKRDQKEEVGGEIVDGRAVMRLNWDLSTGGGQLARIRKAKAERSEAMARLAQTQREVERDIRKAFVEYETAQKQKELNAKRAVVTKDLFATYEKQFEASRVRLLQLMQAENQLFTTELEQINSDYRLQMAEYTTLASSGRLIEALHIDDADVAGKVQPATGEKISNSSTPVSAPTPAPVAADIKANVYPAEDVAPEQAVPATPEPTQPAKPVMMKPINSPQDYPKAAAAGK